MVCKRTILSLAPRVLVHNRNAAVKSLTHEQGAAKKVWRYVRDTWRGSPGKVLDSAGKNLLRDNPANLTRTHGQTLSRRAYGELRNNIAANGIREPIKYVEFNGQRYIVNGHHRAQIARELRIKDIPVERVELPYLGYKTPEDLFW